MSSYFISPLSGIIGQDLFPFCNLLLHLNDGVKKSFLISRRVPEMTSKIDFDSFLKTKAVPRFSVRLFSAPPSPHFTERLEKNRRFTGPQRTQSNLQVKKTLEF